MESCLIADDHPLVREALAGMIATRWPDARIEEAADFPSAWAAAQTQGPRLCLIDLTMPGATPQAGVERLRDLLPEARIVVMTGNDDDAVMLALARGTADGYLQKTESPAVLLSAIELVLAGGRHYPARLAEIAAGAGKQAASERTLTERQSEVLRCIARGLSNKEIARELGVSPATVKTHVSQALLAVGAANRTEAAVRARDIGLV